MGARWQRAPRGYVRHYWHDGDVPTFTDALRVVFAVPICLLIGHNFGRELWRKWYEQKDCDFQICIRCRKGFERAEETENA